MYLPKLIKACTYICALYLVFRGEQEGSPPLPRIMQPISHIWGNHRVSTPSAMDKPRPGKTPSVITVSPCQVSIHLRVLLSVDYNSTNM